MQKNIEVIPYLSFKGSCEEALNTYIEAYGAKGGGVAYGFGIGRRWHHTFTITAASETG